MNLTFSLSLCFESEIPLVFYPRSFQPMITGVLSSAQPGAENTIRGE